MVELAAQGHLDAQVGYRGFWRELHAAIDALLGRRVAGKVVLEVD